MRPTLRAVLPAPARASLRQALDGLGSLPGRFRLMRAAVDRSRVPRVHYGGTVPPLSARSHGGLVKVQHMQAEFPNSTSAFNILYMVSSRPPRGAAALARTARRRGARVVWNQDGVAYPAWHGPGWERTNAAMSAVLRTAHHVFYQSAFCRDGADLFLGRPAGGAEVLHNPVETDRFTPAPRSQRPSGLVLLTAGTHQHRYRFETAVAVLASVRRTRPDAILLVAGGLAWHPDEASSRRDAEEIARAASVADAVVHLGAFAQADAPDVYRRAHILVHAQVNDACPGVVLEAMASGLPVAYSRSGGVPELVGDEAGIGVRADADWDNIVPPEPDLLAEAVLGLATDLDGRSSAARERAVARFDLRPWLARHRAVFDELLA